MTGIFIALGTNIEPRYEHLQEALRLLDHHNDISVEARSPIYETEPVGYTDQAHFLNMVVRIETSLEPLELLTACQGIEQQLGRKRSIRFGPRTIDLDIIMYQDAIIQTDVLTVPHPRMHERAFVLVPLKQLAPDVSVPGLDKTVKNLLEVCSDHEKKDVIRWNKTDLADA
ncbi:2-amino-4-hydroxy-6-hydroxymethyldihydropteridine diphosphokinase [Lentibacillus saliphilus]|uniref:2-amino-4-hydroxy-6- hydroxymethyldihydropteridine diphosphokinase n=1 Tax=Lentibacillus saliphilus TaxID=2737028 RepID=UPI001C2F33C0|nr:2-amino-4-hydroxy-6-hydroxymethyldihydropteridine diphosphokinase [Lentibacillus saliphilus]